MLTIRCTEVAVISIDAQDTHVVYGYHGAPLFSEMIAVRRGSRFLFLFFFLRLTHLGSAGTPMLLLWCFLVLASWGRRDVRRKGQNTR